MSFGNVKIVDPYVEKGWTAELKLTLATPEEVEAVESELKVSFPIGYKEFVTTFGNGDFYDGNAVIRIDMPSTILSGFGEYQHFLDEYWFWELSEDLLPKEKAIESIKIGDTDIGDVIIFHPSNSQEIFVLPNGDDALYKVGSNLYEAIDWLSNKNNSHPSWKNRRLQRYFVPDNPFKYSNGVLRPDE